VASGDGLLTIKSTENMKGCKDYLSIQADESNLDANFTSLLLGKNQNVLYVGTNYGAVRIYNWPILRQKKKSRHLIG